MKVAQNYNQLAIVIVCLMLVKSHKLRKWIDFFEIIYPDNQIKYMSRAPDTNILTFDISFICSVEKIILLFFLVVHWIVNIQPYTFLNFPFGFQIFVFVNQ